MRKTLIAFAALAPIALLPATASAQNNTAGGVAAGATTGAVGGAIVGGPVGAAVGAVGGAIVGGAAGSTSSDRVYVQPAPGAVIERECVQDAAGKTCVESVR